MPKGDVWGGYELFSPTLSEGYQRSKAYVFSQLFGRYATLSLLAFDQNVSPDNSIYKQQMIQELQGVSALPDYETFNLAVLNKIMQILQDVDWNDRAKFSAAVQKVRELRAQA